jgi:hypothetical protein
MKIHLMIMTAMLCFSVSDNCEAQTAEKKNKDEACVKPEECKSNVCTADKCGDGTLAPGAKCSVDDECVSKKCACVRGCAPGELSLQSLICE